MNEILAFHRASLDKHGFTTGQVIQQVVRGNTEHSLEGVSDDGRKLAAVVIGDGGPTIAVQMNFSAETTGATQ